VTTMIVRGMERSGLARESYKPKVVGSNSTPAPAPIFFIQEFYHGTRIENRKKAERL
jgi:hypothetical protein